MVAFFRLNVRNLGAVQYSKWIKNILVSVFKSVCEPYHSDTGMHTKDQTRIHKSAVRCYSLHKKEPMEIGVHN
jgi:hypothetical protein